MRGRPSIVEDGTLSSNRTTTPGVLREPAAEPAPGAYAVGGASRAGCPAGDSAGSFFGDSIPYRRILS